MSANEITQLKAQLAQHQQMIDDLQQQLVDARRPKEDKPQRLLAPERGVTITQITEKAELPSAEVLLKLYSVVLAAHQKLTPDQRNADLHFAMFSAAFQFIASACSRMKPGAFSKQSGEDWVSCCRQWVIARRLAQDMSLGVFVASCMAHAIPNTYNSASFPYDLYISLQFGNGPLSPRGWQQVLRDGVPAPLKVQTTPLTDRTIPRATVNGRVGQVG